ELFVADLTTGVTRSKCQPELKPAGWPGLSKLYVSPDLTRLFVPAKVETDLVGPDFEHWEETIVEVTEYDMATGEVLDSISAIAFQSRLENQVESAFPKRREEWVKGLKIDDFAPFREEKSSESVGGLTTQSDTAYLLVNPSGPNTHIEVWNSPPRRPLVTISLLTLAITAGTWFWLTSRRREVSVDPK
ncbi:MAG: hypothetical protein AB8G99_03355, partial [Planctomycetaceae bacterium]